MSSRITEGRFTDELKTVIKTNFVHTCLSDWKLVVRSSRRQSGFCVQMKNSPQRETQSAIPEEGNQRETTVIALSGTITVLFRDSLSLISFLSVDTIFAMYGLLSVATRRYN